MFEFTVGLKIGIINEIDNMPDWGDIVYIEQDQELGLDWLYVKAESDSMNTHWDDKFQGKFWRMIEASSALIVL